MRKRISGGRNKLTEKLARSLVAKKEAGMHADDGAAGLFLKISNSGAAVGYADTARCGPQIVKLG
jgi:hypothetical protein